MEDHDDGIFLLLRHLAPPSNTNDDIEQSPSQGGITVEGDLEQLNGDSVWSDSLPFANERMAFISSRIVG